MLIKEVCEQCGLTRKSVEYYESKNLIHPQILQNGYRNYRDKEISALKEIAVLRKCGISISDIGDILNSPNKPVALAKYKYASELKMQRLSLGQKCMDSLMQDYNINREFNYLQVHDKNLFTIKEKFVFAFPGSYGLFLALHFGRFLNEQIDTDEKRKAYDAVISYLDQVELYLSDELSVFIQNLFQADVIQLQEQSHQEMLEVLATPTVT